jgi:hypothetical protein
MVKRSASAAGRPARHLLVASMVLALGCRAQGPQPLPAPPPPPPGAERQAAAAPPQFQLDPPPPETRLAPLPTASRRVLVVVTERVGQAENPRRDSESESILAEGLLTGGRDLGLEVVKRGVYEEIVERDFQALMQKGLAENGQVLSNLLKAGVDYLALGELGASERLSEGSGRRPLADRYSLHAGVELVRTDDARVVAVGNADSEERALRDAKTHALSAAAARLVESLRAEPRSPLLTVTITVDGLQTFDEADRIARNLRETEGVVWSREPRFSASAPGTAAGVARYEIGLSGTADDLRARIARMDAGVKLEVSRIDGNRWNYHAGGRPPAAESGSGPARAPAAPLPPGAPGEPGK